MAWRYCNFVATDENGHFTCSVCGYPSPPGILYLSECPPPRWCVIQTDLPPLPEQAKNFVISILSFTASGFKTTTEEERNRRAKICETCEKFVQGRCLECGCYGSIKVIGKVWTCPLNKWEIKDE